MLNDCSGDFRSVPGRLFADGWMRSIATTPMLQWRDEQRNRHSKSATVNNVSLLFIQAQFTAVLLPLLQQVRQAGPVEAALIAALLSLLFSNFDAKLN